jgi:uncharacterized damage-inducible protein DinB
MTAEQAQRRLSMDLDTVRELFRYNTWANTQVLDRVEHLDPGRLVRAVGGSFPSVQATLTHILWAEWFWLERWQGSSPTTVFAPDEFPSLSSLRDRWAQVHTEQSRFLQSLDSERLQRVLRYTNLKGETWEYPLWQQIYHLLNHSSYHRGQVTTLLRLLDAQPRTTDYLNFCDEVGASGRDRGPSRHQG